MSDAGSIRSAIRSRLRLWLTVAVAFPLVVYGGQLLLLALRFGELPNYVTAYDWFHNVARIVRSTPSIIDILSIASDEWLLEIGYMNHDYGNGISEWSFELLPANMTFVVLVGILLATNVVVIARGIPLCQRRELAFGATWTGGASVMAAISSVTVNWVACCGVPSWVTGLSILGMGFSTAQSLKPFGALLQLGSLAILMIAPLVLSRRPGFQPAAARAMPGM